MAGGGGGGGGGVGGVGGWGGGGVSFCPKSSSWTRPFMDEALMPLSCEV